MKKIIASLCAAVMLAGTGSSLIGAENTQTAFANEAQIKVSSVTMTVGDTRMTVNSTSKQIDDHKTTPINHEGRVLLPIRAFVESIGGTVEFTAIDKPIVLSYNDTKLELTINSRTANVNGIREYLDVAPMLYNDVTMLPIRFVAENFGFNVSWNQASQTVTITSKSTSSSIPSPAPGPTAAPTAAPEYDTFDNTSNYSDFFWNNDKKLNLNEKNGMNGGYSLSYDGTKYYYVSEDGRGYVYIENTTPEEISFVTAEGDNINTYYPKYYVDNMRIFKGCLFGIMKESADEGLGRAFVCNPDGSSFRFFAVRQDGGRDYSHNIMARNENGKSFIYLLDSTNEKTDLRKFEFNNGVATETNGRTFDKRLYAYSITDEYEMYTDYYGFGLHCIRRSDGKTIDADFAVYRLNNDGSNFYTFKKGDAEGVYIPCRFTKANLDKAFEGSVSLADIIEQATNLQSTTSIKRLTVCKDDNGETRIYYYDNTKYSEIIFP